MTLNTLSTLAKKFLSLRYGTRLRPHRDWLLLLSFMGVLLVASLAWNTLHFFAVVERDSSVNAEVAAPRALDRTMLTQTRAALDAQAAEDERYRSEYLFVDPSR
ncbi:MAG: hypothetical protein WBK28_04010 [Minisyncoccia bacterium]